jgi:hypothetical protein
LEGVERPERPHECVVHDIRQLGVEADDMPDDALHMLGVAVEQSRLGPGMVGAQRLHQGRVVTDER